MRYLTSPLLPILATLLATVFFAPVAAALSDDDHDHAEKMSEEHKKDQPTPSPAASLEPRQPVEAEEVVYANLEGQEIRGYLARPAAKAEGPLPAILVIQEWWGLNDNIRAMTRRFAGEGYVALAVDLYEGKLATDPQQARALLQESMAKTGRLLDNLKQAHKFLEEKHKAEKIGVVGWCFGGGWSLQTAIHLPDGIDAAVIYYGRVVTEAAELAPIKAPILGLFGELDKGIPVEGVRAFEAKLKELGKEATIVIYPEADHAFANPSGQRYNEAAASDAWKKTTDFFASKLR